ncbi:PREDICTED: uncharacterized protein LOC108358140 isoform X1 [Rhagoletis zephyria]|uniref:uncharacterized protein LOC108358140 isoform X1 n=1 Tax=Rhagoletis zephyria TaxID=28612 RepID=UPI0008115C0D|nr:PREDICTED: uncharacterized protein LOC108358140 isoform X1 [Rhagoletis zephyria]
MYTPLILGRDFLKTYKIRLTKVKFKYSINELKSVRKSKKLCTSLPGELVNVINGFSLSRDHGGRACREDVNSVAPDIFNSELGIDEVDVDVGRPGPDILNRFNEDADLDIASREDVSSAALDIFNSELGIDEVNVDVGRSGPDIFNRCNEEADVDIACREDVNLVAPNILNYELGIDEVHVNIGRPLG